MFILNQNVRLKYNINSILCVVFRQDIVKLQGESGPRNFNPAATALPLCTKKSGQSCPLITGAVVVWGFIYV